jgi:hypothetical protein
MVLPSYMTGKEKREKMAVMETAISSSLSHPNVVQVRHIPFSLPFALSCDHPVWCMPSKVADGQRVLFCCCHLTA